MKSGGLLLVCFYLGLSFWLGDASVRSWAQPRSRGGESKVSKPPRLSIPRINDPNTQNVVEPRSRGDAVIRAAILLDRIKFSPGEIDQIYTPNLGKAISAFQSGNGLMPTGIMDAATWSALNNVHLGPERSPPAISTYVITKADVGAEFRRLPMCRI